MSIITCEHDFRAVGDGRIFCRHRGEYRGSVMPPHVCAPLPCGLPHYHPYPYPSPYTWTVTSNTSGTSTTTNP